MENKTNTGKSNFKIVFKKYFNAKDALLIPNILCYFRIILIFVFFALYLTPFTLLGNKYANVYFSAAVMMIAAYTDFIDGFIARTFNMKSNLGKVLDPIADKFLQLAIALALCISLREFPSIIVMLAVFICKESTLIVQDFVLARKNKAFGGAKWYGKVSTFIFYLVLGTMLIMGPTINTNLSLYNAHLVIDTLTTTAIGFLLLAWILYSVDVHRIIKHGPDEVVVEKEEPKEKQND